MNDTVNSSVELTGMTLLMFDAFETAFPVFGDEGAARRHFATLLVDESKDRLAGGSGYVCRAHNVAGETFALKRLHLAEGPRTEDSDLQQAGRIAAFREEYATQLVLSHLRGFPAVYGYGAIGQTPAILMEWIEGISLRDAASRLAVGDAPGTAGAHTGIPGKLVASIGLAVANVLLAAEALDESFIHRDLSPTNILICTKAKTFDEQVAAGRFDIRIIDFGSSMFDTGGARPTFTQRTDVWRNGTPAYAAPEMLTRDLEGSDVLRRSPSIDVYALCSVLYELYAGRVPYRLDEKPLTSPYLIKRQGGPDPLPPKDSGDKALVGAVLAGIKPNQADRITLRELRERLATWLGVGREVVDDQAFQRARSQALASELRAHGATWKAEEQAEPRTQATPDRSQVRRATATVARRSTPATPVTQYRAVKPQAPQNIAPQEETKQNLRQQPQQRAKPAERQQGAGRPLSRRLLIAGGVGAAAVAVLAGSAWGVQALLGTAWHDADDSAEKPQNETTDDAAESSEPTSSHETSALANPEELLPAQDADTGLWGYIDAEGTWAAAPTWEQAPGAFSNGLAAVWDAETGYWGYVDSELAWVIEPSYPAALPFNEAGLASAQDAATRLWGIIDKDGSWVAAPSFAEITSFSEGWAPACALDTEVSADLARYGQTWGYLDENGSWAIAPAYAGAGAFGETGMAPVAVTPQSWQFITKEGSLAWDGTWSAAQPFHYSYAAVLQGSTKRWGYIDANGTLVIDYTFDDALPFYDGVAPVQDRETALWGLINTSGVWVAPPQFSTMRPFSKATGLAGACDEETGLWGLVDTGGAWVVEPAFTDITTA